jgi:hypothetical protein
MTEHTGMTQLQRAFANPPGTPPRHRHTTPGFFPVSL